MLKIDTTTNDLVFANGTLAEVSGVEQTGQRVYLRLYEIIGEWFLDLQFGLPYLDQILGQNAPNIATIEAIFKTEVRKSLEGEAVLTALRAVFDGSTRVLKVALLLIDAEGKQDQQQFLF